MSRTRRLAVPAALAMTVIGGIGAIGACESESPKTPIVDAQLTSERDAGNDAPDDAGDALADASIDAKPDAPPPPDAAPDAPPDAPPDAMT